MSLSTPKRVQKASLPMSLLARRVADNAVFNLYQHRLWL
ncbi:hypothetical protein BN133_2378 [Cronobacter dublinensis 582]|nr:hypothetical protein BN133_2378 [Cronobacter dublinensis 582]